MADMVIYSKISALLAFRNKLLEKVFGVRKEYPLFALLPL